MWSKCRLHAALSNYRKMYDQKLRESPAATYKRVYRPQNNTPIFDTSGAERASNNISNNKDTTLLHLLHNTNYTLLLLATCTSHEDQFSSAHCTPRTNKH